MLSQNTNTCCCREETFATDAIRKAEKSWNNISTRLCWVRSSWVSAETARHCSDSARDTRRICTWWERKPLKLTGKVDYGLVYKPPQPCGRWQNQAGGQQQNSCSFSVCYDRHGLYPGCSTGVWITTMQAKCLLRIAKCHLAGKAYVEPVENWFQGSYCNWFNFQQRTRKRKQKNTSGMQEIKSKAFRNQCHQDFQTSWEHGEGFALARSKSSGSSEDRGFHIPVAAPSRHMASEELSKLQHKSVWMRPQQRSPGIYWNVDWLR